MEKILLLFTLICTILIWFWLRAKLNFWKSRGVLTPPHSFPFGNIGSCIMHKNSIADCVREIYTFLKSRKLNYGGAYFLFSPFFVPIDTDLVKSILQKDYNYFYDRGYVTNEKNDPLTNDLFSLEGRKWKLLRSKLSPTFTSGKMKMMFESLSYCTRYLTKVIDDQKGQMIDTKEVMGKYSSDSIVIFAYGLDPNSPQNPGVEFLEKAKSYLLAPNVFLHFMDYVILSMPELIRFLNVPVVPKETTKFFINIVKEIVNYREKNNVVRKDFMNTLIEMKKRGRVEDNEESISGCEDKVTIEFIAAQAWSIFVAGYDMNSTTLTLCLYELAKDKSVQTQMRNEIRTTLDKFGWNCSYEAVGEMLYMEQVIEESLRKYPPQSFLQRVCTKNYSIPNSDCILTKGQKVLIPVIGIHYDPEYYPDPEKFDPDRFSEQNRRTRPAFSYLPFGEGPKICIGIRFLMIQIKLGLISLLMNYDISLNENTKEPVEFKSESMIMIPKHEIFLDFKKISDETIDICSANL